MAVGGFRLEGFDEIRRMLDALGAMGKTIARQAMREALKPTQKAAAAMAPRRPWILRDGVRLYKSIRISTVLKKSQRGGQVRSGSIEMHVGSTAPHAHLVEFGHVLSRGGNTFGHVPAYPFMRPAWDETKAQIVADLRRGMARRITTTVARLRRQAASGTLSKRSLKVLTSA